MCLMLYIAADQEIAEHTRGPVTIQAIDDKVAANLALVFTKPHRGLVSVDGGCSCDFPSFPRSVDYFDGIFHEDSKKERPKAVNCTQSLLSLVAEAAESSGSVELFPTWAGYEGRPPKGRMDLRAHDVVPEEFFFVEWFVYEMRSG